MKGPLFRRHPLLLFIFFLLIIFAVLPLFNRFFFAPKILLLCLVILFAVLLGKGGQLYRDWFIFFSFLYLFDSLRGTIYILTCKLNLPVYLMYVINAEKKLFGQIPSVFLQSALLKGEEFTWLEKFLTIIHGTHFVAFLFVGLLIWIYRPEYFTRFKTSFYWATALGVSLYFIVPTAPPWIASLVFGLIPDLINFNGNIYNMTIPDISSGFVTNPVAAMPSLHAAFPILCSLILWRIYRWKAAGFTLYTLLMLFTIVYTGDHYVVDILAGFPLALLCYILAFRVKGHSIVSKPQSMLPELKMISKPVFAFKYRTLVGGAALLALGISIGTANKNQFSQHPDRYDYTFAPRYEDFFNNQEAFQDNFKVQLYFGNHFLLKKEYLTALLYFERARKISKHYLETTEAEFKIKQLRVMTTSKK